MQNFCQDAWLDDTGIRLQLKQEQLHIPFDQIENVTYHGSNNPPRAKIHLKQADRRGAVYTFNPDIAAGHQRAKQNVESLNTKMVNS